ncbi:hypothetical protein DL764_002168 [Monosporascus ibericus]|uniref:Uncharacterized protein n=1 Tax=Monosporascus ibericus TaxID=155417 RepID=A0A4Q4TNC6_9PEZI|nr:hypothetical protein DL764_002168 [Monosporascus ibericus]
MSLGKEPLLETAQQNAEKTEDSDGLSGLSHERTGNSYIPQTTYDEDLLDEFADMDEHCLVEKAAVVDAKDSKKQELDDEPPALPERSTLRASRLLDNLKLNSIESARQSLNTSTSHDIYLSSEEDASSTTDDLSDYDFESECDSEPQSNSNSDESTESSVRRRSREVTARAVSVIFVGRPSIVDLSSNRVSSFLEDSTSKPQEAILEKQQSIDVESLERPSLPPRQDSLPSAKLRKQKPAFLDTDPFASGNYSIDAATQQQDEPVVRTPRTPTAVLQRFQKSLSLVRKRSRHNLRAGISSENLNGRPASVSTSNLLEIDTSSVPAMDPKALEPQSATTMSPYSPLLYNKIARSATGESGSSIAALPAASGAVPPAIPPANPATSRKSLLGGLNLGRRRSIRVKSLAFP